MDEKLRPYLTKVDKPARYIGGEYNLPDMDKACSVRFCMCFVDVYEVGMSNLGIQILYDILNKADNIVCERCFAPWPDLGKILKEKDIPLSSIETGKPLKDFDVAENHSGSRTEVRRRILTQSPLSPQSYQLVNACGGCFQIS